VVMGNRVLMGLWGVGRCVDYGISRVLRNVSRNGIEEGGDQANMKCSGLHESNFDEM